MTSSYLPPISWYHDYCTILRDDREPLIDVGEHYVKPTIAMPDGPQPLIIPVEAASSHVPMHDIRISEHGNWRHHHWNALRTAYGKSPFFEYYADDFAPFFAARTHDYLIDFNTALHEIVCRLIDITQPVPPAQRRLQPDGTPQPYYQVFAPRLGFLPDLSILDLLFNMGPESILYL